jgi:hypothetical protein
MVAGLITRGLDGRAYLTHDVQRVLGRNPTDVTDYARAAVSRPAAS